MMDKYCSPDKRINIKKNNSCFDKPALVRIINAFNEKFPEKKILVNNIEKKPFKVLYKELNARFEKVCGENEICWVDSTGIDSIVRDYIRPKTPASWKNNPREWLDSNNINDVLQQYEKAYSPYYKYYLTQSADFLREVNSKCYNEQLCNINIQNLHDSGVRTIGMIINLDTHDLPGSHWVSLFACICPFMPCFGVYYYDSRVASSRIPQDVKIFMNMIEKQCNQLKILKKGKRLFKNKINTIIHQHGRTECGVFSLYNQLKWLECSQKTKGCSSYNEVFNSKINDEDMEKLRKVLFRPA